VLEEEIMRSLMLPTIASAVVTLTLTAPAYAQSGTNAPAPKPAMPTRADHPRADATNAKMADEDFVNEAAMGGMAEVELGKLARDKASDAKVKALGARMLADHSKANAELKALAARKNITLPTQLDSKHQATVDRLSKLSGAAFDQAYVSDMLEDHETDVAKFADESKEAKDPDVKAWAAKTLPTLREHLTAVQDAHRAIDGKRATGN